MERLHEEQYICCTDFTSLGCIEGVFQEELWTKDSFAYGYGMRIGSDVRIDTDDPCEKYYQSAFNTVLRALQFRTKFCHTQNDQVE